MDRWQGQTMVATNSQFMEKIGGKAKQSERIGGGLQFSIHGKKKKLTILSLSIPKSNSQFIFFP
jgi:hypothetical protein